MAKTKMTYKKLFELAKKYNHWKIDEIGWIRNKSGCCPIVAAAVALGTIKKPLWVARNDNNALELGVSLGLSWAQANAVMEAADNNTLDTQTRSLRTKMEKALCRSKR